MDSEEELKGKTDADLCLDVQALTEKILQLRSQLVLASQRVEKSINIQG